MNKNNPNEAESTGATNFQTVIHKSQDFSMGARKSGSRKLKRCIKYVQMM